MRIKHEDAVVLEAIVRRTFNCERGGMGGFVDADHFEREPFDAAIISIAPLWQRSNPKEIEEFLFKWESVLRDENIKDADIHTYINEFQQAERFLKQALAINRSSKNLKSIASNLNNLCLFEGNIEEQLEWINEAIIINKHLNATWSLGENYSRHYID